MLTATPSEYMPALSRSRRPLRRAPAARRNRL